jgi:hypothetical protein
MVSAMPLAVTDVTNSRREILISTMSSYTLLLAAKRISRTQFN